MRAGGGWLIDAREGPLPIPVAPRKLATMSKSHFRNLILLYAILVIASLIASSIPGVYSKELSDAMEREPMPWIAEEFWPLIFGLPLVVATVAGLWGLYLFKPWGRTLSLYTTAAGLALFPFLGPSLSGGLESAFYEASSLVWGAVLTLAYYSPPISAEFTSTPPQPIG
jgi:hypothetical protein